METNPNGAETDRLLGVAEKLLQNRDFQGARDFALLAQETEPLLDGSDQILAVIDVLLAANRRINNHLNWYSILQIDSRSDDLDLIKRQYRHLALLLHPDKNRYAFADHAFKLVGNAWAVLSDPSRKPLFDKEHSLFTKIDLPSQAQQSKLPVRRTQLLNSNNNGVINDGVWEDMSQRLKPQTFWTACPYCYIMYEYPNVYEECCLRCQKCQRAFQGTKIESLPPSMDGKESYYCCLGFFPLGYTFGSSENGKKVVGSAPTPPGFPNWMPPVFSTFQPENNFWNNTPVKGTQVRDDFMDVSDGDASQFELVSRKRGKARKQL